MGLGAVMLPLLGLSLALAGFGRIRVVTFARAGALFGGLTLLVPYAIGVTTGIRSIADFPADYALWTLSQKLVGVIPALITLGVRSVVGTAGAVIVGLLGFSVLTAFTIDWHPFRAALRAREAETEKREEGSGKGEGGRAKGEAFEDVPERPSLHDQRAAPSRRAGAKAGGKAERDDEPPPIDLLVGPKRGEVDAGESELDRLGEVLVETLATFKVEGSVVGRTTGPVVTQYELAPAPGVKVGRIAALENDLALAMKAQSIRIVAPIPGKAAVGIEIPNPHARIVTLRELLEAPEWDRTRATLPLALGRNLEGRPVIADLAKMPHLLIAGATGSGKSVCINTIITSLIYRYTPRELRMLMIDPKMVELSMYNALPHLRHPVVTDNRQAAQALKWTMIEMERRYELFHANGARNIEDFNRKIGEGKAMVDVQGARVQEKQGGAAHGVRRTPSDTQRPSSTDQRPYDDGPLPFIVLIVDELADLMMTVQGEVEKPLAILAQKARATGVHLILATQRPSVNVITGLIKANFPSRIAFRVASKVDSRTILDQNGAEALLGNGDMLFLPPGKSEPTRIQGAFIGTEETEQVMEWYQGVEEAVRGVGEEEDIIAVVQALEEEEATSGKGEAIEDRDPLFLEAAEICIVNGGGSTSLLQRKMKIGYGRAARIIDQLFEAGILGPSEGARGREVLISMGQLDEYSD